MLLAIKLAWQTALSGPIFRNKFIFTFLIVVAIAVAFPYFFGFIEGRTGRIIHDLLLTQIPAIDVSIPVFVCIWSSALLLIFRGIQTPQLLLTFAISYILLTLCRFATILALPLEAPADLIALTDPISNYFYGEAGFITKDLFFSGHTSTLFMIFLALPKAKDRIFALVACVLLGILLLVQHVHYTMDILAAPFFTYFIWELGQRFSKTEIVLFDK